MTDDAARRGSDCSGLENLEPRLMLSAAISPALPSAPGTQADVAAPAHVVRAMQPAVAVGSPVALSPTVIDTVEAQGAVRKIYVFNTLALAIGDAGVQIASIADPRNPLALSRISTTAAVTSVAVAGTTLYIGQAGGTLAIYDIPDPANPHLSGQMTIPGVTTIQGMAFLDNTSGVSPKRLYLACLSEGVRVIDVTAPASPALLGGGGDGSSVMDVAIVGDGVGGWAFNALAVIMGNLVSLVNAADPNHPITYSAHTYSSPYDLFNDGVKLYVTDANGLHVLDAGSFTRPVSRGLVPASPAAQSSHSFVAAAGPVAYFSQVAVGVSIIDVGNLDGPTVIGTYDDPNALGVAASGTILYVADGDATWDVVDTGITRDLTVNDADTGTYYVSTGKTFKVNASINNLGNLTALANQHSRITGYLSVDDVLDSSDYLLSPITINNAGIAPLDSLVKTLSLKAPGTMSEGFYHLILKLDNAGAADGDLTNNLWISPDASVQVMKGKPVITMTLDPAGDSGIAGDRVTNITPISFSGTTRSDCTVTLKRGRTVLGTTTSAADGTFSFADVALVPGTNSLTVTATDRAGKSGTLSQRIVLDTAVSASTLKLDRTTDSGKLGDFLTKLPAIKLTGTTEKNSAVTLLVNNVQVASGLASSRGAFSFTDVSLTDGPNDVTVQITDAAGNTTSVTKTVTLDQAAATPTLALAAESDTGAAGDNITSLSKVKLTGTAEPGSKVYLKVLKTRGYAALASTTAAADGTFTFAKVTLKPGDNTFGAFVTDLAGNMAETTGFIVTLQPDAPA